MKKVDDSTNLVSNHGQVVKKERHIVSWSREEDDILREQIRLHGSENWAIIASNFKDKTTRQCRRRWFTYLNSDFKKGGWSPEEDILLCEAQRIYGNRWTEIAKVVSGRTDNAVKNRFTTLCKKRAKLESLAKVESTTSYVNLNNKRVIFRSLLNSDEGSENANCLKKIRASLPNCQESTDKSKEKKSLQTFLNKDDPKVFALMQQSELLTSLAIEVNNTEATDEILETAWTVLQDFLKQNKESQAFSDGSSRSSWRDIDMYASSPAGSHYSIESTNTDGREESDAEIGLEKDCVYEENVESINEEKSMRIDEEIKDDKGDECDNPNLEFNSPSHVTPLFRTLAAEIPTPKFSESEKHFLMKTLGLESTSPSTVKNPPCKRSLLHCL